MCRHQSIEKGIVLGSDELALRSTLGVWGSISLLHVSAALDQTEVTGAGDSLGAPLDLEFAEKDTIVSLDGGEREE